MCLAIVCFSGCDVVNFEINFLDDQKVKTKIEISEKHFLIIFNGLLVAKNCFRPENTPLMAAFKSY